MTFKNYRNQTLRIYLHNQIAAKSPGHNLSFEITSGPAGARIQNDTLIWARPHNDIQTKAVQITATDSWAIEPRSGIGNFTINADMTEPAGMRFIPSKDTTFQMGSWWTVNSEYMNPHDARLTYDFFIDTTEITQQHFEKYFPINPSSVKNPLMPVTDISWFAAALFCNKRSAAEGLEVVYEYDQILGSVADSCKMVNLTIHYDRDGYRLPVEAEWEFAYRARSSNDYYWSHNFYNGYPTTQERSTIETYEYWEGIHMNSQQSIVASKLPNNFGLYDMAANVGEIINDYYNYSYGTIDLIDPKGPVTGTDRTMRFGNYSEYPVWLTAWAHFPISPTSTNSIRGFRCMRVRR
ncbi:MAG: SUMF1/EgtB/PvdO family nonheme iron enzyme [Chitinivibrionales bacterium]|nr:SUMF1/EgtB/PvdO family nonheme iron enzyme [Chitinivibrionales bacterium]